MLEIRNKKGSPTILVLADPLSPTSTGSDRTELAFTKIGKHECLSQIWENDIYEGNQIEEPMLRSSEAAATRQSTQK